MPGSIPTVVRQIFQLAHKHHIHQFYLSTVHINTETHLFKKIGHPQKLGTKSCCNNRLPNFKFSPISFIWYSMTVYILKGGNLNHHSEIIFKSTHDNLTTNSLMFHINCNFVCTGKDLHKTNIHECLYVCATDRFFTPWTWASIRTLAGVWIINVRDALTVERTAYGSTGIWKCTQLRFLNHSYREISKDIWSWMLFKEVKALLKGIILETHLKVVCKPIICITTTVTVLRIMLLGL